jgi:RNA polymerase sigma-70 factor, ECF subfamily
MRLPDYEQSSDQQLVRSFVREGDSDAIEELLRRHQARVYGLAYRILGNRADAADATQEVFLLLLRKLRSFKEKSAFTTWLHRLTINASYDLARKRSRAPQPVERIERAEPDAIDAAEARVAVEAGLAGLAVEHRTALVLREIYGMSYEEISTATGAALGTVKSRISRARVALAEKLGAAEISGEPSEQATRLIEEDQ